MMWSRALLLASLVATCFGDLEPEREENYSLLSARSIFGSLTDLFNAEDFITDYNNATEEFNKLFTRNHSQEILHQLQKSILEAKLSDFVPSFILNAASSRPTGRSVGGIFSTFRNSLNDLLDNALGWLILQGYSFMPDRMDAVMEYLESDGLYWDGPAGHHVHRRDATFDDSDFIRLMSNYQPDKIHPPKQFISPTPSPPAKCPNDTLWYTKCVKVISLDYWTAVKKRTSAALTAIRKYLDHE